MTLPLKQSEHNSNSLELEIETIAINKLDKSRTEN